MCSCGRFQHYEIPFGHVVAVLKYRKLHEANFYSVFYILKNFKDAYVITVESIPASVHGIYQVTFHSLNRYHPVQKDQREDQNLNAERGLLMWNSKGQKSHAVDAIKSHNKKTCSNYPLKKMISWFYLLLHIFLCCFDC